MNQPLFTVKYGLLKLARSRQTDSVVCGRKSGSQRSKTFKLLTCVENRLTAGPTIRDHMLIQGLWGLSYQTVGRSRAMYLEGGECRNVFRTFKHKVVDQQFIQIQLTMNSLFATIDNLLALLSQLHAPSLKLLISSKCKWVDWVVLLETQQ